jgi:hypothetical protein
MSLIKLSFRNHRGHGYGYGYGYGHESRGRRRGGFGRRRFHGRSHGGYYYGR